MSVEGHLKGKKLSTCTLEKRIGQGGMGEVYLARQERPQRWVAVKVLRRVSENKEISKQFLARFQREANLIAKLEHKNIIPIYEYGEQDDLAYLIMPYLTGGSLQDLLTRRGHLELSEAASYIQQAADALDYAHARGIIHRDLKPANFLLHADGRLVLADFGIAHILADEQDSATKMTLTSTGMLIGTPDYMAPEMARGETIDHRADIYELGIVLYQMLSGNVPFKGNTPLVVAAMHMQQPLPSLHMTQPLLPITIDAVMQKATEKAPAERFQSAGAMAQALTQVIVEASSVNSWSTTEPTLLASPALIHSTPLSVTSGIIAPTHLSSESISHVPQALPLYPQMSDHKTNVKTWFILFSILLAALLITGGILVGLQLGHSNAGQASNNSSSYITARTVQTPDHSDVKTPEPDPTASNSVVTAIDYPSYTDAEKDISDYYTQQSDFRGQNIIQHFNSITYGPFLGPPTEPQFLACAEYQYALVSSPDVTQDTARHTFTFQYGHNSWSVIDMGNWASC